MENFIKSICKAILLTLFFWNSSIFSYSKKPLVVDEEEIFDFKKALREQGIDFVGSFIYHLDANLVGGIKTGVLNQWLVDLGLLFHSEKIFHYPGGELFINLEAHEGKNPSFFLTGDAMIFDGISAPNYVQFSEYWAKQSLGNFSVKFGRMLGTNDLCVTNNAKFLMNNTYETPPTIQGFPAYPSAVPGAILTYDYQKILGLKLGIFNGEEAIYSLYEIYPFGLWRSFFENIFVMSEIEIHLNDTQGRFVAGLNYNRSLIAISYDTYKRVGFSGYLIGEYNFYDKYRPFVQGSIGDPSSLIIPYFFGCGMQVDQFLPIQFENHLILGLASSFFSKDEAVNLGASGVEISLEASYRINYFKLAVQPDFQYIIRPGGMGLKNALAFILNIDLDI